MNPAPFMHPLGSRDYGSGNVYEMRTYTYAPGDIPKVLEAWTKAIEAREKFSPLAACWTSELGGLNKFVHTWVYKDLNERARVREEARKSGGGWPPHDGGRPIRQENKLLIPNPFSPPREIFDPISTPAARRVGGAGRESDIPPRRPLTLHTVSGHQSHLRPFTRSEASKLPPSPHEGYCSDAAASCTSEGVCARNRSGTDTRPTPQTKTGVFRPGGNCPRKRRSGRCQGLRSNPSGLGLDSTRPRRRYAFHHSLAGGFWFLSLATGASRLPPIAPRGAMGEDKA